MDEDRQFRSHPLHEGHGIIGAQVVVDPVPHGGRNRQEEHPGALVLVGDPVAVLGIAHVREYPVSRVHPEPHVRGVAVDGFADFHPQAVDIEDVAGFECGDMGRSAQMIRRERRSEPSRAVDHRLRSIQASALLPSSAGHPLDHARGIGVVVGVAVRDYDGIRLRDVIADPLHLRERPRSGVYVEELPVVLYQESAGGAGLIHRGMAAPARSEKCHAESHAPLMDGAVFRC